MLGVKIRGMSGSLKAVLRNALLKEALALPTTWPSKAQFNPWKVGAFGRRAEQNVCLRGLPHAMKILKCLCETESCQTLQVRECFRITLIIFKTLISWFKVSELIENVKKLEILEFPAL